MTKKKIDSTTIKQHISIGHFPIQIHQGHTKQYQEKRDKDVIKNIIISQEAENEQSRRDALLSL